MIETTASEFAMIRLLEEIEIVAGLIEADFNSDQSSDTVNLANYQGCLVVITKPAGTAGDDILLQLKQAQDVGGTGAKALNISSFYYKVGTQTGVQTFTRIDLTTPGNVDTSSVTGNSYAGDGKATAVSALDLASEAVEAMFVIPVRSDDLDVSNGFTCVQYFNDGTHVANALLVNVTFVMQGAKFPGEIPLSAIV